MELDHGALARIVESLETEGREYFAGRKFEAVRNVSWIRRPYSQLALLQIDFSGGGGTKAFVKLYRHPRRPHDHNVRSAEVEYGAHKRLFELFGDDRNCSVVRPIALYAELGGWVMEFIDGKTLDQLLRNRGNAIGSMLGGGSLPRYAFLAGTWLKRLQEGTRDGGAYSPPDDLPGAIRAELDESAVFDASGEQRIMEFAGHLATKVRDTALPTVGMHGECFTPHHIFVSNGRLIVFDITGIKYGPPYEDFANFWVGLEALLKYPLFRVKDVRRLQQEFLRGYSPDFELNEPALLFYKLKHMLRLLNSLARSSERSRLGAIRTRAGRKYVKSWILAHLHE